MESQDTESMINQLHANWDLFEKNRIIPAYYYIWAAIRSYEEAIACAKRIQWTIAQARDNYQKACSSIAEMFGDKNPILPDIEVAGQRQKGIDFIREQRNNYFHYLRAAYDMLAFAAYQGFLRERIENLHPQVHEIKKQIKKVLEITQGANQNPKKIVVTNTNKWFSSVAEESGEQIESLLWYIIDFDDRIKHEYPLASPYHWSFTFDAEIIAYTTHIPAFKKKNRLHQDQDLLKTIPEFNNFIKNAIQQFIDAIISDQEKCSPFNNTFNGVNLQQKNHASMVPIVYTDHPVHDAPETIYVLGSARRDEEMKQLLKSPSILDHVYLSISGGRTIRYDLSSSGKNEYNIVDLSIPAYNRYSRE